MFCLECRSRDYTEDNRPALSSVNRIPWLEDDGPRLQREEYTALSKEDRLYRRWYTLVEYYAFRDFTYAKDKLPAIQGMAQEMASFLGDVYLASLWKRDLSRGFMWQLIDYGRLKLQRHRAPSWSWANFDGHINWTAYLSVDLRSDQHICGFELLDFTSDQVTHNCDKLKIRGKLVDVSAALPQDESGGTMPKHDIMLQNVKIGEGSLDLKNASYTNQGLRAFLVHYEALKLPNMPSYKNPIGLLLEKTETPSNEYRRLGTFASRLSNSESAWHGKQRDLFDQCPTEIFTLV